MPMSSPLLSAVQGYLLQIKGIEACVVDTC